jgi:hypothetical protein
MRPGYLGKWVEFHTYDQDIPIENMLENFRERQQRVKYSEFFEKQMSQSAKAQRARANGRVPIGDVSSQIHLLTGPGAPKND